MASDEDPDRLAEQLDEQADELQRESDRLGEKIDDTRTDWEQKRRDPRIPGAPPPPEDEEGED